MVEDPGMLCSAVDRCATAAPNPIVTKATNLGIMLNAVEAHNFTAFMEASGYSA